MIKRKDSEVLIVGAGPAGLAAALNLARHRVPFQVIDQDSGPAARSYACLLHPDSLELLDQFDLTPRLLAKGRRIDKIAIYAGATQAAEISLADLPVKFPFALALPQSYLELFMAERLKALGEEVAWCHRLGDLDAEESRIGATLERLGETGRGYIVPDMVSVVQQSFPFQARFVIGSDGAHSTVRHSLDVELEPIAEPKWYGIFEFEAEGAVPDAAIVLLNETGCDIGWPMSGGLFRWNFHLPNVGGLGDVPSKERVAIVINHPHLNRTAEKQLSDLLQERAPWFAARMKRLVWNSEAPFETAVAKSFGRGHCWLAGDAAHETIPVGGLSMNAGIVEGAALGAALASSSAERERRERLEAYQEERRHDWSQLLGIGWALVPGAACPAWARQHAAILPQILPVSGRALQRLFDRLGVSFQPSAPRAALSA